MERILEDLLRAFEQSKSEYMLTGAILMQFYGEPRTTGDIDVVVEKDDLETLVSKLKENNFQISEIVIGHNTLQHRESNFRVDMVVRESIGEEVAIIEVEGWRIRVSRPENLILKKLEWMGNDYSWKDASDVVSMFVRMRNKLDTNYIFEESKKRGLLDRLRNLLAKHGIEL